MKTGQLVLERRKEIGITQAKAAKRAGIEQAYWSQIERGGFEPTLRTLKKVAAALKTDVASLLPGHDEVERFREPLPSANHMGRVRNRAISADLERELALEPGQRIEGVHYWTGHPCRLKSGGWGVWVNGEPHVGDHLEVITRAGKVRYRKVAGIITLGDGWTIVVPLKVPRLLLPA